MKNLLPIKSVIITGGTGFIGSALTARIRENLPSGEIVFSPGSSEVDLVNREESLKYFERLHWLNDVSHIFHLAAVYKAGGWPQTHPGTQFYANMQINLNVLEGWKRFFPKARMTSVVSYCMYPDHDLPHKEEELWGTEPEPYLFSYAFTKKALLVGQRAYCQEFGLEASSIVLPTVYGPRDDFSETSHVIGALIGKFVRAVEYGTGTVEVWGEGNQVREFIHVDDVINALLLVAKRPIQSEVLNLGSASAVTIRQLVEMIRTYTDYKGKIVYNPNRFVGALVRVLDNAKLISETGWKAEIELEKGIEEVVRWYSKQQLHR